MAEDRSPRQQFMEPANGCFEFLVQELALLATVERALTALPVIPPLIELIKSLPLPGPVPQSFIDFARMTEEPAAIARERELDGLRTLHSNLCVSFWAAIETTIEEILINHLLQFEEAPAKAAAQAALQKLPDVTDREGARDFVRAWEKALGKAGFSNVIERLTLMLRAFDLVIDLHKEHQRRLTELSEFRNLAVHRRGMIDGRYLAKVPWCTLPVETPFPLDRATVTAFYEASTTFALGLTVQLLRSPWAARLPL